MIMIKFTAGYINGDTNFVIQNIKMMEDVIKKDPAICILKNILQRSFTQNVKIPTDAGADAGA